MKIFVPLSILLLSSIALAQDYDQISDEFKKAAAEFSIPAEILQSLSFCETRWQHLQWDDGDTASCAGLPHAYGIMALRNDDWFGRSLITGSRLIDTDPSVVKNDRYLNIRAGAAYLKKLRMELPAVQGFSESDPESWANAVAAYCGIPQKELARQHALEVLERIVKGFNDHGIVMIPRPLNLNSLREEVSAMADEMKSKGPVKENGVMGTPDYPLARWIPAAAGHWYTTGYLRDFIVVHDMEGYYLSCISYFQNSATQASVHYCLNSVQDNASDRPAGDITQMVEEQYWAWHAVCWNRYMLGIEHEGFASNPIWFTPEMYLSSAKLIKFMCEHWGIPKDRNHIIAHGEYQNSTWMSWLKTNYPQIDGTCNSHVDPGKYWDWNFLMQLIREDTVAPKVTSLPPAGAVPVYNAVSISFDQRMERASTEAKFKITPAISGNLSWSLDYRTLSFKPAVRFEFSTMYTVMIDTGSHNYLNIGLDQDGDNIKGDAYSFTFITSATDTIPPKVISLYPAGGSAGISSSVEIVMQFDKPLDPSTVPASFKLTDSAGTPQPLTPASSVIIGGNSTVRFRPMTDLKPSSGYSVMTLPGIKDYSGNTLASPFSAQFTTEASTIFSGTIIDAVNSSAGWWQPSASGSTIGVTGSFAIAADIKKSGSGSGKIIYNFTGTSGGVLREHDSNVPSIEGGSLFGMWVYGDYSWNELQYWFYYVGSSGKTYIPISLGPIDWTGWKLKTISTGMIPGTSRQFASFVINQTKGGAQNGTVYFDDLTLGNSISDFKERKKEIPQQHELYCNYPNPFNPVTTISYAVPRSGMVTIKVYDAVGREAAVLVNEIKEPGEYSVSFDASNHASGIYLCRMTAGNAVKTMKMALVK